MKTAELKPAEYNPRKWSEEDAKSLEEGIRRFGFVDPLVVNIAEGRENVVIGGHFRLEIAKRIGIEEVPVVYVNIADLAKEKELNLWLNRNVGQWDWELLSGFDEHLLSDIGFDSNELDSIFGLEETDEFDVNTEKEKLLKEGEIRTEKGQLWELGENRLIIGDSTVRENWIRLFRDERFDFMFTDPPYRLAYSRKRVRKVKTKEGFKIKREREYIDTGETDKTGKFKFGSKNNRSYEGVEMKRGVPEFDEWLSIAKDFQKERGVNVMIFENWRNLRELWNAIEKYWAVRNLIIWHLPNRTQGFSRPHSFYNKYDIAFLAEHGNGPLNEEVEQEVDDYLRKNAQKVLDSYDVILYAHDAEDKTREFSKAEKAKWGRLTDHITWTGDTSRASGQGLVFGTKPLQILIPYMKALSPRGGVIAEPFGGSGSTIIASEILKRKCYAIELSPLYAEVILRRWERFTHRKAVMRQ